MKVAVDVVDAEGVPLAEDYSSVSKVVEDTVNRDLEGFDAFCRETLGEPLSKMEASIVKTYVGWKLGLAAQETTDA